MEQDKDGGVQIAAYRKKKGGKQIIRKSPFPIGCKIKDRRWKIGVYKFRFRSRDRKQWRENKLYSAWSGATTVVCK